MDLKKKRENINNLLININNCKNSDEFYQLTTKLYYRINEIVFYFENKNLNCEVEKNVSDYRTNID